MDIRFHGRGGQGTVLAAKILADIVLRSGKGECQAMPEFGVERRGAPVVAYARISESKILLRSRIYEPDAVVLIDPSLAADPAILRGLKPGGLFIVNTEKDAAALDLRWPGLRLIPIPARRIALAHKLGSPTSPIVSTVVCGALTAIFRLAEPAVLEAAIRDAVPSHVEANVAAAREAFDLGLSHAYAQA